MMLLAVVVSAQTAIGTAEELASMSLNGQYYLTNDIELVQWTPLGVFTGSLDGRGHCIRIAKGLPDANGYAGLFSVTDGATLSNLIVGGSFCEASTACGSLAGRAVNTQIENCETEATLTSRDPAAVLGGLVGVMVGGSMSNCSSNASMEGVLMGGLAGSVLNNATIQNCYSSASFVVVNDDTEGGYLAHDNAGILENNYVRMIEQGWYIATVGQTCMMFGAKAIIPHRNNGLLANWSNGRYVTTSLSMPRLLLGLDAYNRMYAWYFSEIYAYQTGRIPFIHDISGVGYNIGDVVYVGGVKSFVFYIHEDGYGGWVTPCDEQETHVVLTSNENDAMNGYYHTGGAYVNSLELDYAQGHDGKLAHGRTVDPIPSIYRGNTGKFFTCLLRDNDDDPTHQVNNLQVNNDESHACPSVKQLAFRNSGEIRNCYYPMDVDDADLVADGTTDRCSRYEELLPPYQYGEYGPWLYADGNNSGFTLVDSLNAWVEQHDDAFCSWSIPCTPEVNANLPIHRYGFHNGSSEVNTAVRLASQVQEPALRYADLNDIPSSYRSSSSTLAYYGNREGIHADNVTTPWDASLFITEEATLKGDYQLTANVAVTFDNSDGSEFGGQPYDWHSFSTSLADAPVGIDYNEYQVGGPSSSPSEVLFNDENGYFPLNTPYVGWDFYCYDEPNVGWPNFKRYTGDHYHNLSGEPIDYENESQLVPGKGYLWAIAEKTTLQASGRLNNGSIEQTMTCQGRLYAGYNLVGNPYQAYLDFDAFCSDNSEVLEQQAYSLLDADKRGYVTYCPGASDNPDYAPRYLHPHQGFFVQAKYDNSRLRFDPDQTVVTPLSDFRKGGKNHPLLSFSVTDQVGTKDYATVEFDHDHEKGVLKMDGIHAGNGMLSIGHQGKAYSIILLEGCPRRIPIRFSALTDGAYTLQWQVLHSALKSLRLIDHLTGVEVDGLKTDRYTFSASKDDYESRFEVVFEPTEVGEVSVDREDFAFLSGSNCVIDGEGELEVMDLTGRKLLTTHVEGGATTITLTGFAQGVYLLRLEQSEGVRTQKIILH